MLTNRDRVAAIQQSLAEGGPIKSHTDTFEKVKFSKLDQRIANTIGYGPHSNDKGAMLGAAINFIQGKKAPDTQESPITNEFFRYSLGDQSPLKYIEKSPYKPTQAEDPNSSYMRIKNWSNRIRNNNTSSLTDLVDNKHYYDINYKMALENYKIDKGEDNKGKYVSMYDVWDFANPIANKFLDRKPEVYDRLYYKDNPTFKQDSAAWENNRQKQMLTTEDYEQRDSLDLMPNPTEKYLLMDKPTPNREELIPEKYKTNKKR